MALEIRALEARLVAAERRLNRAEVDNQHPVDEVRPRGAQVRDGIQDKGTVASTTAWS
jgi:hypothetical protein